jgi:hypothetical protein
MKTTLRIIYLAILLSAMTNQACRKIIPTDIETKDKKIVMNGLISPSGIEVRASLSLGLNDISNAIEYINDAEMVLYKNDEALAVMVRNKFDDKGLYYVPYFTPEIGVEYTVKIEKSPYQSISASSYIPETVKIDTITYFKETVAEIGYTYLVYSFYLTIDDPKETENYYFIADTSVVYDYYYDTYLEKDTMVQTQQAIYLQSTDPVFEGEREYAEYLLFSDETFNGQKRSLKVSIDEWAFYGDTIDMKFYLYSITKEYYLFLKSRALQLQQDEISRLLGATPVQIFSNVENGFGYFGGQNYSTKSIELDGMENNSEYKNIAKRKE